MAVTLVRQRVVLPEMKRRLLRSQIPPSLVIALMACVFLYVPYNQLNSDFLRLKRLIPVDLVGYAYTVLTAVAAIAGWIYLLAIVVRRTIFMAEYGIEVTARVEAVSTKTFQDKLWIQFTYSWNGKELWKRKDQRAVIIKDYRAGDPLVVLVDPRNPKRVELKRNTFWDM